jgi:nucleotide-binding universal stress UspA family protein
MAIVDMRRAPARPGEETSSASNTIRRVLLPLDGTRHGDRVVERAIPLARVLNAEVELIRAYTADRSPHAHGRGIFALRREEREPLHAASLYLARLEGVLRARGVRTFSRALQWPMAAAILDAAETDPPDLIYLTAGLWRESEMRRSADEHPLLEVLTQARVPVLLDDIGEANALSYGVGAELRVVINVCDEARSVRSGEYVATLARAFGARLTLLPVGRSADTGEGEPDGALRDMLVRQQANLLIVCLPRTPEQRRAAVELVLSLRRTTGPAVLFMP